MRKRITLCWNCVLGGYSIRQLKTAWELYPFAKDCGHAKMHGD